MNPITECSRHYPDNIAIRALLQDWNMEFLHQTLIGNIYVLIYLSHIRI